MKNPIVAGITIVQVAIGLFGLAQKANSEPTQKPVEKKVLYGHINELGSIFVSSGLYPQSTQFPTPVLKVKMGSPAYYAGIKEGDQINEYQLGTNLLKLKINRNGKIFLASMRARTDKTNLLKSNANNMATGVNSGFWNKLKEFDIVFVVDRSGSMFNPLASTGKARWQWVKEQIPQFCSEAQKRSQITFTLCLFNNKCTIEKNLSADDVRRSLYDTVTTGSTDLASAFKEVLRTHTDSGKPVMLIVLTDGQTLSSGDSENVILNFADHATAGKRFQLVCIQSGQEQEGARFISALKRDCASRGISKSVHALRFEEVSQEGIAPFLIRFLQ
ncbi:MAG: VWA domain-containing protein [Candidatus Melainabacteria bacterium]|nr:MAG: VWA domain-containing protein [Candidatus Melainabacteria bacterium]